MTELRPFQKEGVRRIYQFKGRALLADEMGLGKTIQALYWILKTPRHRPVVIVSPANMTWTWQAEAHLHFGIQAEVLEGLRAPSKGKLPSSVVIIGYAVLPKWLPFLLANQPDTVIIDEIHYVKNPQAQRSNAVYKLCQRARSVVGLSGTPLLNKTVELWAALQCIQPRLFPSFQKFVWRYSKPRWTAWGWNYKGAKRTKELHKILSKSVMIRRLKKDVFQELPPKTRQIISFKLDSYKEYHRADRHFLKWLRQQSEVRARRAKKNPALTKIGYLLRLVADLKLKKTIEWLKEWAELNPDKKMVGMTMHRKTLDALCKYFPNSVVIHGGVTGKLRTQSVRKFQTNKKVKWLWGQWQAAGVGLTMTAAHHFVALDFPWDPGTLVQGEDRVHRIGQKETVTIYYLAVLNTIEEKLIKILTEKADILDAVLNGTVSADSLDIYGDLLNYVEKEENK